jgi:hypothetical protein
MHQSSNFQDGRKPSVVGTNVKTRVPAVSALASLLSSVLYSWSGNNSAIQLQCVWQTAWYCVFVNATN